LSSYANLVKSPSNFLSAIVLAELYVGATQSQKRAIRGTLEKHYARKDRIVIPTRLDYTALSEILQRLRGQLDINHRSIAFDVLIALTARQVGATVVTEDSHFEILKKSMRRYRDFSLALADRSRGTIQHIP
jgi:predicted nucleic acid-binding protein